MTGTPVDQVDPATLEPRRVNPWSRRVMFASAEATCLFCAVWGAIYRDGVEWVATPLLIAVLCAGAHVWSHSADLRSLAAVVRAIRGFSHA